MQSFHSAVIILRFLCFVVMLYCRHLSFDLAKGLGTNSTALWVIIGQHNTGAAIEFHPTRGYDTAVVRLQTTTLDRLVLVGQASLQTPWKKQPPATSRVSPSLASKHSRANNATHWRRPERPHSLSPLPCYSPACILLLPHARDAREKLRHAV